MAAKKPISPSSGEAILARIDKAIAERKAQGLPDSDRAISIEATGKEYILASIRKGLRTGTQQNITIKTLNKIAFPLGRNAEWLLTGRGPEYIDELPEHVDSSDVLTDPPPAATVPLIGYVSAGAQAVLIPLPDQDYDRVPAPPGYTATTRALEIRGDSLGELFDRWLVYYDDVRSPITHDLYNRLCIVGLPDGRIVIKKVKHNRNGLFDLLSNTEGPIKDVQIEWAARVRSMEPR